MHYYKFIFVWNLFDITIMADGKQTPILSKYRSFFNFSAYLFLSYAVNHKGTIVKNRKWEFSQRKQENTINDWNIHVIEVQIFRNRLKKKHKKISSPFQLSILFYIFFFSAHQIVMSVNLSPQTISENI